MKNPAQNLEAALAPHGFRLLTRKEGSICSAIWKRQTINTNRAVALVEVESVPVDLSQLLKKVKKEAAFRCGFFPFFYGLGTQVILLVTNTKPEEKELGTYVDKIDNQWSIIQSIFIVHVDLGLVSSARTWGQFITGKYQDVIAAVFRHPNET
jgi:hypothetical protein